MRIVSWPALVAVLLAVSSGAAIAQAPPETRAAITSPRWAVELKGGDFEPDLDSFETFYGDDRPGYWATGFTYAFTYWLEAGAEIGYMNEDGVGVLTGQGIPGGAVRYKLFPAHAFVNVRGLFRPEQLFVPYLGVGLSAAYYEERIEQQPERTGVSELGSHVRVGCSSISIGSTATHAAATAARPSSRPTSSSSGSASRRSNRAPSSAATRCCSASASRSAGTRAGTPRAPCPTPDAMSLQRATRIRARRAVLESIVGQHREVGAVRPVDSACRRPVGHMSSVCASSMEPPPSRIGQRFAFAIASSRVLASITL